MTTKANKYGLRAAAAERTKKHAQRTPLPPKAGHVAEVRALREEPVPQPETNGERPDDRSQAKAAAFVTKAGELGWDAFLEDVAVAAQATATRGNETIVQAWRGGVWQYDASVYASGDRTTKPRNASGAAKYLSRSPEEAAKETAKVASNVHFRKAAPKDIGNQLEAAKAALPFDPELSTDEVVLIALAGQSLVWYNRISRSTESAIVGRSKSLRMTVNEEGARVVLWCCPVTGFRACLVTAILKVGRGRVESAETAKVLVEA